MLLLLTIIGVAGIQTTLLEERMAGNMRDRNLAFQAAESALRDAESDITSTVNPLNPRISGYTSFSADCGKSTTGTNTDDGLCWNISLNPAMPTLTTVMALWNASGTVSYGTFTGASAITGLSAQPRYLIESYRTMRLGCIQGRGEYCYRITVRAQGADANTVVWLQTIYKPK